jgi:[ribosomal protein S5]-alanine N-acetyltransferase
MPDALITTARLDLILQTPEEVLAYVAGLPAEVRAEFSPDWIARVRVTQAGDFWALGIMATERASGSVVGNVAFKGPPDANGVVEIAYGIDESCRGRGFATEAAEGLTRFAFQHSTVRLVCAHTKADNGASARVLTHCGFAYVGDVIDPEDGEVCRWERGRETAHTSPE